STYPGHADFLMLIQGANFLPGAVLQFDGVTLTPLSLLRDRILVMVPAAAVASAHTASIKVINPICAILTGPPRQSNVSFFPITNQTAGLQWTLGNTPIVQNTGVPVANLLALGDFNGDGHQDLAVVSVGSLAVFLGNGKGSFSLAPGSPSVIPYFQTGDLEAL